MSLVITVHDLRRNDLNGIQEMASIDAVEFVYDKLNKENRLAAYIFPEEYTVPLCIKEMDELWEVATRAAEVYREICLEREKDTEVSRGNDGKTN